jgi:exopolysaccharide biosynthesis polyprenyl glycosylphosphotransferase
MPPSRPFNRSLPAVAPLRKAQPALRFSERKLLLAGGDLFVLCAALSLMMLLRGGGEVTLYELWAAVPRFAVLCGLWVVVALLFDAYDLARAASALHSLWAAGGAALATVVVYVLIPYISTPLPARRLELFLFAVVAVGGVAVWRVAYARVFVQPTFHLTALVVGAGWAGHVLAQAIAERGEGGGNPYRGTGYRILGFVDDDPAKQSIEVHGVRVLGTRADLPRLAGLLRPDELIVAITDAGGMHDELFEAILDCWEAGIPVTTMSDLYERITGRVPVEHAGRNLHVVLPVSQPAAQRLYVAAWRGGEFVLALAGCAAMLCLAPAVWLANVLTCQGPLFYRQERVGKGGRPFQVIKFRSMVPDAEGACGAVWSRKGDDRITPVGRFLRKTRLDEVPQFWNVLRGEMSLIGPRPERPAFVEKLAQEIPFYRVRHAVKPGITGWAQVKYPYGASVADALVKLQYDLYYVKHQGPYLDLSILIKSVQVVLGMRGR